MRYASGFTGIEAASVAYKNIPNWTPVWFSQYDPEHNYKNGPDFASALLKHHYPDVPNLGDILQIHTQKIFIDEAIDLFVGGSPCQDYSKAGERAGMDAERGKLALRYCDILDLKKPRWFKFENVPGLLTSGKDSEGNSICGKDFAQLLSRFTGRHIPTQPFANAGIIQGSEDGYFVAWRVLDAQFFGVPQYRRRIFIIGYSGNDWRPPTAVLFDNPECRRHIKKSKKKKQAIANTITTRPYEDRGESSNLVVHSEWWDGGQIAQTLDAVLHKGQTMPENNRFPAIVQSIDCRNMVLNDEISTTLQAKKSGGYSLNYQSPVIYPWGQIASWHNGSNPQPGDAAPCLAASSHQNIIVDDYVDIVRRLTPLEAERLQGFEDGYTNIPWRKKTTSPDSRRYHAIGNSWAVPCARWIGRRIDIVDRLINPQFYIHE